MHVKRQDRRQFCRHSGRVSTEVVHGPRCWFLATMLRYCSAGGGSIKGGGMEPPGKKRRNLRSSFSRKPPRARCSRTPTTHDCLVDLLMSVYSSVPFSTWLSTSPSPFFFSAYFYLYPLSPSTFALPSLPLGNEFHLARERTGAILGLVNSGIDADKRPSSFHQALDYFPARESDHTNFFLFFVHWPSFYLPWSPVSRWFAPWRMESGRPFI